jgi:hypothetical protein
VVGLSAMTVSSNARCIVTVIDTDLFGNKLPETAHTRPCRPGETNGGTKSITPTRARERCVWGFGRQPGHEPPPGTPGNAGQRAPCCRYSRANMHVRHHPVPPLARATPSPIRFCLPTLAPQKRAAPARDASSQDRTCPAMLPLARTRSHCHATSNMGWSCRAGTGLVGSSPSWTNTDTRSTSQRAT